MLGLVVCGRGPDWNDMALHRACRRVLGSSRIVRACDLSAYVGPDGIRFWHGSGELAVPDACFLRSLGPGTYEQLVARLAVLEAMEEAGALVVNPALAAWRARDKFSTILTLRKAGFAVPKTYITESSMLAYSFCSSMEEFIYKPITGSLGFGAMRFSDRDLAFNIFRLLEQHYPLYLQEFLREVERELRVFVLSGRVVACAEKVGLPGAWRRNVAQGGRMLKAEVAPELEEMCVRACELLGLIYAGIDVLEARSGHYVALEVNSAPNWRGLQEATGIDVAQLLAQEVAERIRR